MADRRREGRSSRSASPRRRLSRRVLIVCGGERTEKRYFEGLKRAERNPAVSVVIKTNPRSPVEVVGHAHKLKRQSPDDFDDVWCVFDVDEFKDLDRASVLARRHRIGLAVSNPCFELWLLLHFVDHKAHCPSYADLQAILRRQLPRYDKTRLDFADYASGVEKACARAMALDPTGAAIHVNPSTGVWQVVRLIEKPR